MTIGKSSLLAILALLAIPTIAQEPGQLNYTVTSINFLLANPPAAVPLANIGVQRLDNPGSCSYYYWVVANFPIGNASPAGPVGISNGACTLVNGNRVSWSAVTGAASYDVLRTSTLNPPSGACGCAVATGVTTLTATDTGALGAYTVVTFNPSTVSCLFDNEASGPGASSVQLRCSNLPPVTIGSVAWNNILNPTGDQSLSMGTFKSKWFSNGNGFTSLWFDPLNGFGFTTDTATGPTPSFSTTPPTGFELRNNGQAIFTARSTGGPGAGGFPAFYLNNGTAGQNGIGMNTAGSQWFLVSGGSNVAAFTSDGRYCVGPSGSCFTVSPTYQFEVDANAQRAARFFGASNQTVIAWDNCSGAACAIAGRASAPVGNPGQLSNSYLHLGETEFGLNSFRLITFGFQGGTTWAPCYLGYKETDTNNRDAGDLVFGCRSVNTDSAPSEAFRVDHGTNKVVADVGVDAKRFGCNLSATHYSGADPAIVLSAGWGNTAVVANANGCDQALSFSVTANGTGIAANPTITITFKDGAFPANFPIGIISRNDTSSPSSTSTVLTWVYTTTTLAITFNGTPVAGVSYAFFDLTSGT